MRRGEGREDGRVNVSDGVLCVTRGVVVCLSRVEEATSRSPSAALDHAKDEQKEVVLISRVEDLYGGKEKKSAPLVVISLRRAGSARFMHNTHLTSKDLGDGGHGGYCLLFWLRDEVEGE